MHKGPKCIQSLWDHTKKIPFVQKHKEGAICAILREKTPFLAFPEAKKGVVHCARLRKAAQGCARLPTGLIITQIPQGYQKKSLLCRKARYVRSLAKKPHFWPSQRIKKVLFTAQGSARLRKAAHWANNNANPSGLSEKKVYCVEKRDMCDP